MRAIWPANSPVCESMWSLRWCRWVNLLSHTSHGNGRTPFSVCINRMCFGMVYLLEKFLPQIGQAYGILCTWECLSRNCMFAKLSPHWWHMNGRSPVWRPMWTCRDLMSVKDHSHPLHRKGFKSRDKFSSFCVTIIMIEFGTFMALPKELWDIEYSRLLWWLMSSSCGSCLITPAPPVGPFVGGSSIISPSFSSL